MLHCTMSGRIVFLLGSTATGKSDLALALSERLPVEIISVDSAMVYRGMDIGSAKPSLEQRAQVRHALVDICDPSDAYSAGRFVEDALKEIARAHSLNRIPLLVGGTMLYFRALTEGLADLPVSDPDVRAQLSEEATRLGWEAMYRRLKEIDPLSAERIHPNDPQRILRALEVEVLTKRTLSELIAEQGCPPLPNPEKVIKIALAPPSRELLRARIAERFEAMLEAGLVEEVQKLWQRGDLDLSMPAMRAVGYRQIGQYLSGEMNLEEATERAITATRQLAKRQMTWLRKEPHLHWFDSDQSDLVSKVAHHIETEGSIC
jgi:tRNA dimethylallyltransferase